MLRLVLPRIAADGSRHPAIAAGWRGGRRRLAATAWMLPKRPIAAWRGTAAVAGQDRALLHDDAPIIVTHRGRPIRGRAAS